MTPREKILRDAFDKIINNRPPGYGGDREVGWIIEVAQTAIDLFDKLGQADEIKDGPGENDINTIKKLRRLARIQELNGYQVSDILRIAAKYMGIE